MLAIGTGQAATTERPVRYIRRRFPLLVARTSIGTRLISFVALFLAAVLGVYFFLLKPSDEPPIYHPAQLDSRLVEPGLAQRKEEHRIIPFSLTDQDGRTVTLDDARGKVLLADFFFTTCGTICPKMTVQMERVQEAFLHDDRVLILSHSVTPEIDSVAVLQAYAQQHGVRAERWRLLTGDRAQIYRLARTSWFAVMDEGDGGPDDFVHTENFVLADPQGRLRGFYDGTSPADVDRAIADIRRLLKAM